MSDAVEWERMDAAARARYEREHGHPPPGYRGTGEVNWFARFHPESAPCCKCGRITDRWVVGFAHIAPVSWGQSHVDQPMGPADQRDKKLAIVWDAVHPFCWPCERRAAIADLEQGEQDPRTAAYLAELLAEERSEIVAPDPVCGS